MDTQILKEIISVIRAEQQRRASLLIAEDPNFAYDHWLFTDEPFVKELCLMLLVALRHQVERELVGFAAQSTDGGKEINRQQYQENVRNERERLRKRRGWKSLNDRLQLKSCKWHTCMEALRLLANSYKHHPSMEPDEELLKLLKQKTKAKYASLPESDSLRQGLAAFIGLWKDTAYWEIAERFVDIASDFLVNVQNLTKLSKVQWGSISLNPNDFAR